MLIQFQPIQPHPLLKDYIERMWLFRSSGCMPVEDAKLVVPNGRIKLTLTFCNGVVANIDKKNYYSKEHDIILTGLMEAPLKIDAEKDEPTQTIGIEFSPLGAYRFFQIPLDEIRNEIFNATDIFGKKYKQLQERIANAETTEEKIYLLQQFLLKQFSTSKADAIFEYCVGQIISSKGKIRIRELEKKSGYSSRWLNVKFARKLGVSPKSLSSIIRFKQYYQAFANNTEESFFRNDFYDYYYDRSHFLKDFTRYTGSSYKGFSEVSNDFGKNFYKE